MSCDGSITYPGRGDPDKIVFQPHHIYSRLQGAEWDGRPAIQGGNTAGISSWYMEDYYSFSGRQFQLLSQTILRGH